MPELPEVESLRQRIASNMVGARIVAVEVRRPDLRRPFPRRFTKRLTGQTIIALSRRAKYLLALLSSNETLLIHLGMSGWLRIVHSDATASDPHDHVVLHLSSGKVVTFNDPRRFGVMDLIPSEQLESHPTLSRLGPEPLSNDFNAVALARACRGKRTSLKAALLDQRVVAGLGNIYAAEALHVAGLSPLRRASTLAMRAGAPRESTYRLVSAIKQVLKTAIARQSSERDDRFIVYEREGHRCSRRGCTGTIRRRTQGGRSTFYCPVCQR